MSYLMKAFRILTGRQLSGKKMQWAAGGKNIKGSTFWMEGTDTTYEMKYGIPVVVIVRSSFGAVNVPDKEYKIEQVPYSEERRYYTKDGLLMSRQLRSNLQSEPTVIDYIPPGSFSGIKRDNWLDLSEEGI